MYCIYLSHAFFTSGLFYDSNEDLQLAIPICSMLFLFIFVV